jgi:hypothetical protein
MDESKSKSPKPLKKQTKKAREAEIKGVLQTLAHRTVNKSHDQFPVLLQFVSQHDTWKDRLDSINAFRVTRSRMNKALLLQIRLEGWKKFVTTSWRKCVGRNRKPVDVLDGAMRNAVSRQILNWKNSHAFGSECHKCQTQSSLEADHHPTPFSTIKDQFLVAHASEVPKEFRYSKRCQARFRPVDGAFTRKWQRYHAYHAQYQWLCKTCNSSKGNGKRGKKRKVNDVVQIPDLVNN